MHVRQQVNAFGESRQGLLAKRLESTDRALMCTGSVMTYDYSNFES